MEATAAGDPIPPPPRPDNDPDARPIGPAPAAAGVRPGRARATACVIILATGLAVYLISSRILTYSVNTPDIVGHLFQAEVFAMGKLCVPSPPIREAFDTSAVVNDGKMYSRYEPGHAAVLALGLLLFRSIKLSLGALAALNAFLVYRLALALWRDRTVALLATAVLALSPFFVFASSIELPHTSAFMFDALFLLAMTRALRDDTWFHGFLAGLACGAAYNTRPLEALGFALPGIAAVAWRTVGIAPLRRPPFLRLLGTPRRLAVLAAVAGGFAILLAATLAYNRALTGDPFLTPRERYNSIWGIQDLVSLDYVNSPRKFYHMYYDRHLYVLWVLADHFFSLAVGFQILVALFILIARDTGSRLLIAIILFGPLPLLAYNWYADSFSTVNFGPRYLFSLLLPLTLMTGKLAATLYRRLGRAGGRRDRWPVVFALAYLCIEGGVRADLPRWLARERWTSRWRASLREQVLPPPGEHALVFISCSQLGASDGMFWNHPSFQGEVIFAKHRGLVANLELQRTLFPDRTIYLGKTRVDPRSFVTCWDVTGPFYFPFPQSLDHAWIDEARATAPPPRRRGAVWTTHQPTLPVVDFAALFAGQRLDNAAAYARATIRSDAEKRVVLRFGSDDGIALWLNGELLAREPVWRSADLDQGRVEAQLHAGANLLLVKVIQHWASWQLVVRVTDADGNRPPGLAFSSPLLDASGGAGGDPRSP